MPSLEIDDFVLYDNWPIKYQIITINQTKNVSESNSHFSIRLSFSVNSPICFCWQCVYLSQHGWLLSSGCLYCNLWRGMCPYVLFEDAGGICSCGHGDDVGTPRNVGLLMYFWVSLLIVSAFILQSGCHLCFCRPIVRIPFGVSILLLPPFCGEVLVLFVIFVGVEVPQDCISFLSNWMELDRDCVELTSGMI